MLNERLRATQVFEATADRKLWVVDLCNFNGAIVRFQTLQILEDSLFETENIWITARNHNIAHHLCREELRTLIHCLTNRLRYSRLVNPDITRTKEHLGHSKSLIRNLQYLRIFYFAVGLADEASFYLFVVRQHKLLSDTANTLHLLIEVKAYEWALLFDLLNNCVFPLQIYLLKT